MPTKNASAYFRLIGILACASAVTMAAELRPETLAAWKAYLATASERMQGRPAPAKFMNVEARSVLAGAVKQGKAAAEPIIGKGLKSVPGGTIHDWIGATFIPNITIERLTEILGKYHRYKDFYAPAVVDAHLTRRAANIDFIWMRTVHKASIFTLAIDTDLEVQDFRIDENHKVSSSRTTCVRQIKDYGKPNETLLAEGQGDGFLWNMYSITHYEQREGGVYVELEVMALTRDIPRSIGWLVRPIAVRTSRNSILLSLAQTRAAVESELKNNPKLISSPRAEAINHGLSLKKGNTVDQIH